MHKTLISVTFLLFMSLVAACSSDDPAPPPITPTPTPPPPELPISSMGSDLDILRSCTGETPIGQCINADFNKDGLINLTDLSLFRQVLAADFNGDTLLDLREAKNNEDIGFMTVCVNQTTQTDCTRADLNLDGLIDKLDMDTLLGFLIFDINNDKIVDFSTNKRPIFQNADDIIANELETVKFYIWASDNSKDKISYFPDSLPVNAILTSIIMGDVNNDNTVDAQDVLLIENAGSSPYEQRFDLNNDKQVDQQDIDLLQKFIGENRQAQLFEWSPGNTDSGIYTLRITATDESGLTTPWEMKLTVYDVDAYTGYYSYDDVLLVINNQSSASQLIGQYFIDKHSLPINNVVTISTAENETIARQAFEQNIRLPIEKFIRDNQLTSQVNYIVTTKGVPLRIANAQTDADHASVDSELSLILGPLAGQIGVENGTKNPYYKFDTPFSREMFGVFLVTRLTGYTVSDVYSLIDRAALPESTGTFVLDVDPTKDNDIGNKFGNEWMREAATILQAAGFTIILEQTNKFVTNQNNVLGYASWGSNDANATNNAKPNFVWLPGSIAETYVSSSARTFTSPAVYGQSLVADLIAEGATGAKGYVYEPFLNSMAKPSLLFDRYAKGYNLADSYFAASSQLGWQGVVIGDPKMAIRRNIIPK